MNNYYVVATAKHTLNLRGKQYKIGEAVPTELTEKEYEFYKDALNVESAKEITAETKSNVKNIVKFDIISPEQLEKIKADMYEELKEQVLKELEAKTKVEKPTETEVKPKRPYAKKETK